jgi:ParB family chromosome partitioning protein
LAESIKRHGLLQPLLVVATPDGYQLVAGDRRLQASRLAGLRAVPALVRQAGEQASLEMALIENLQRENLNPLEEAEGFRQLADDFSLSHDQIAGLIGRSRSDVSNTLRLLKLSSGVREALAEGQISAGHARALLGLGTAQDQTAALRTVLGKGLNVRQTEALIRQLGAGPRRQRATPRQGAEAAALESQLEAVLGTRVRIKGGPRGGQVIIHYYSDEELNAIADRLLSEDRARK